MNSENLESRYFIWTWPQQASTYKYWALVIFFLSQAISATVFFLLIPIWGIKTGLEFSTVFDIFNFFGIIGLIAGWIIATFINSRIILYISIIQILLLSYAFFADDTLGRILVSSAWGLMSGIMVILIPSILASGRGGIKTFSASLIIILLYEKILKYILYASIDSNFLSGISDVWFYLLLSLPVILGVSLVVPVKSIEFNSKPKAQLQTIPVKERNFIIVLLLSIIPFFYVYYAYRFHGELATYTNSNNLLSKRAALWVSLLFPLTFPVVINGSCENQVG